MASRPPRTRTPLPLAVAAAVAVAFLLLPLVSLVTRVPWADVGTILASDEVGTALKLSLLTSTLATAIAIVLGVPLAWLLARSNARGIGLLRALVMVPMVLPPVVGGVALLSAFGRRGVLGQWLDDWFGVTIPFTTTAAVMAATFVAMPFLIITVEGAFRLADQGLEEAASTLGASRMRVFRTITLPLARPALIAGAVLCWARALGEFGATITFAGNANGRTRTMPLEVYLAMESDPDAAATLALLLLLISVAVLLLLRRRWWTVGR